MFRSFIKPFLMLLLMGPANLTGQETPVRADSLPKSQAYGLRVGIDLSRPLISALDEAYTGFEIVGDFRLRQKLYLAAELGNESRTVTESLENVDDRNVIDLYEFRSSGSYVKLGVDINTYENWFGMNNSIFIGARYAFSTFSKDLNAYRIYESNRYWNPDGFTVGSNFPRELGGLNASWLEMLVGVKAELFANIFLGASVRLGLLVSRKESDVMPNIWIPGFNRVTTDSSFGANFNYTLTYFLPLYRKARKRPQSEEP